MYISVRLRQVGNMDDEQRTLAIEEAAYAVLAERGYKGASMLAIAKRARVSNETLYARYANKAGLFATLVRRNSDALARQLDGAVADGRDPLAALMAAGSLLYELLTSERVVLLNRAAAADVADSGTLGRALAEGGRERIAPKLIALVEAAADRGVVDLRSQTPEEATEIFLGVLLAEHPVRRIIGSAELPEAGAGERRAERATDCLVRLFAPVT